MALSELAQSMYTPQTWALAVDAASARTAAGNYQYTMGVFQSAAAQLRPYLNVPGRYSPPGLATLFGMARRMELAADQLTAAPDAASLSPAMVSSTPWSRDQPVFDAAPVWQVRAEVTYRAPDGTVVTTWGTGIFHNVLPASAGDLRAEVQLQMKRMLSQQNQEHNTGGELLSVGRTYLMAV